MAGKRSSITLSVAAHEKARLEALALAFGQTWGEKPNVSKLVKAIAQQKIRLAANHDWERDRIDTLNQALNLLKDEGHYAEAIALAQLLLERSELNRPLRAEIQDWVDEPRTPLRRELERCLQRSRPFQLAYQDASERVWRFTVRHAKVQRHEDRQYLDCWCDETAGNQDVTALRHNWSFRLDRLPEESVISPAEGHWQPALDFVEVEFHLLNRLAIAYRSKTAADVVNEWLPEQPVRRVVRRVHNTFWFLREVRRYGADCLIVGPQDVRERFVQDLERTIQKYQ